jgi:hypothetical protein
MIWGAGRNQTSLADFKGKFMKMAGSKTKWRLYLSAEIGFSCNLRTELDGGQATKAAPVCGGSVMLVVLSPSSPQSCEACDVA